MNNRPPTIPPSHSRANLTNKLKNRHSPQRIARLVVGAVLSFTVAIALPFFAPWALFPTSMSFNEDSAPVVVDGQSVFRIKNTATTTSATARADTISKRLQKFAQNGLEPETEVLTTDPGRLATVSLGAPTLENASVKANFTVTARDTASGLTPTEQAQIWANQLENTFETAKAQRQSNYIRRHLWQIPVVPFVAAIAHWLSGILWRNYLAQFLKSAATDDREGPSAKKGMEGFTAASLFLNTTLLLLRLGIWIGALLYATNLFPETRRVSYRVVSELTDSFTANTLQVGSSSVSILDIFQILILILLVMVIAGIISNVLKRRILQETGVNRGVQEAITIILRYTLIFIGSIIVLQASGINLSSLTLLASALGVGAGLGLQNIVKDIGSGLVLVFERPVQVGEFVEISDQSGTVERIGARSTEIRTLDQISIIVPNSQFLENEVVNWSHRNPISRIRIPVGVAYKSDPETVREILLQTGRSHPDVLKAPPVNVLFKSFGDSALQFDLLVWVAQPSRQFIIKSDLLFMLSKALHEAGIEIPFPQRDIHVVWGDTPGQSALPVDRPAD